MHKLSNVFKFQNVTSRNTVQSYVCLHVESSSNKHAQLIFKNNFIILIVKIL